MNRTRLAAAWVTVLLAVPAAGWAGGGAGAITGTVESKKKAYRKDTVVYVEKAEGRFAPPKQPVVMGQKDATFVPRVLVVLAGTTVEYTNGDPTDHSVYSPDGKAFDLGQWGQGKSKTHTYGEPGVHTQLCKLHPMMLAYVIVVQNPYHATTNAKGEFAIENVPPGKYTLRTWNERYRADAVEVEVKAGEKSPVTLTLHR